MDVEFISFLTVKDERRRTYLEEVIENPSYSTLSRAFTLLLISSLPYQLDHVFIIPFRPAVNEEVADRVAIVDGSEVMFVRKRRY